MEKYLSSHDENIAGINFSSTFFENISATITEIKLFSEPFYVNSAHLIILIEEFTHY